MKILHLLSGGGIGGIETLCRNIAELSTDENEFCFLYSGGMIADQMQLEGTKIYRYYEMNIIRRLRSLLKLVRADSYDVVVLHHEGIGIYIFYLTLCFLYHKIIFIKYLHCSYDPQFLFQDNRIKNCLHYCALKNTLIKSNHIIAVSEFVKQSYCHEFNCLPDKVSVIYNGISKNYYQISIDNRRTESESINLLYVGRLVKAKGIYILLQAIAELRKKGQLVELELLGDGQDRMFFEELTKQLSIDNCVTFRGNQLDKKPFYQHSQIFVYPSILQEAFGISIVEAMAAGLICVASRTGGIPEIITDKQEGFLFKGGSLQGLVEAISEAICHYKNGTYLQMQALAMQKATAFSMEKTINKLHEVYIDN